MVKMRTATYYNGTSYKCGDECKEDAATQKRWIKNGIAESAESSERNKYADMTDEELSEYADQIGVDISRVRSREAAIAKIEKSEQ